MTTIIPRNMAYVISHSTLDPNDKKTYVVPDALWPIVEAAFSSPNSTIIVTGGSGKLPGALAPYSGHDFAKASSFHTVAPGAGAGLNFLNQLPSAAIGDNPVTGNTFKGISGAINSTTDFLQWVAWIFHPVNILRAVEFLFGGILMLTAIWSILSGSRRSALDATGGGIAHVTRELAAASPVGRAQRVRQGRRMGKREGQRESARMSARQEATREQRTSSANERERINASARDSAREQRRGQSRSSRVRSPH